MRVYLHVLSLVLGGSLTALGQSPVAAPRSHSLSLHVEPVSTGGTSDIDDAAHTKSVRGNDDPAKRVQLTKSTQTETNEQGERIRIDVRNFSALPDTAQIEWYFMARLVHPAPGQQDYVLDAGAKPVTVPPGGTLSIPVESKKVTQTITRKANSHFRGGNAHVDHASGPREDGSILTGWMVRVVADNKVLDARGSKQTYEDQAKDLRKLPIIK